VVVDFDALEAAGIANARGRAGLIDYLDKLGFTPDEMLEASVAAGFRPRRRRHAAVGPPHLQPADGRDVLGVTLDDIATAWAVLGLTVASPDEVALSEADVDGLATWVALKSVVGDDAALGLLRVLGATMARLAEAGATVVRLGQPDIQVTHSQDELITAQAYRGVAEFIPRIGAMIDAVHRHHLISARTHFEGVMRDPVCERGLRHRFRGSVGFHRADHGC